MTLSWTENHHVTPLNPYSGQQKYTVFSTRFDSTDVSELNTAIAETIEKAASMLNVNINDDSRYLIFEWDQSNSTLTVAVTNDRKDRDSEYALSCQIQGIDSKTESETKESLSEQIRYSITNYLTTCASFMHFSLVALYHDESRRKTVLL